MSRTILRRTLISYCLWVGLGTAQGQNNDPPAPYPTPATAPAPTKWSRPQVTPAPASATPPAPYFPPPVHVVPTEVATPVQSVTPGRVVKFQKPVGSDSAEFRTDIPTPNPAPKPIVPPQPPAAPVPETTPSPSGGMARENVFRLDSESKVNQRIQAELIREAKARKDKEGEGRNEGSVEYFKIPPVPQLVEAGVVYKPKTTNYPSSVMALEPGYVVHRRLYFEERNAERYGWDLGIMQPALSTLCFYKDVALFPAHIASNRWERYDSSAGKCAPGSPVPLTLYPEGIDLFGASVGAATWVGISAAFIP